MKTVVLLRHAEPEQPYSENKDFDRDLTTKGVSDAILKGQVIKSKIDKIQLFISSSSVRTKNTSQHIAEQIGFKIRNISFLDELYLASPRIILQQINSMTDEYQNLLIVGHNPGISFLSEYLTNENLGHFDTSGAVGIQFDVETWMEISENTGKLIWSDFSKS